MHINQEDNKMKKEKYGQYAIDCYLDYLNNYLTVSQFAIDYGYDKETAMGLIIRGRKLFNESK
jgi:hypothetical protein